MTNFDQRGQSVLNQYNAQTINVLVSQSEAIARIQWRPLEAVHYAVREDSSGPRHLFSTDLFKSLIRTFEGKGYKRFTALFDPTPTTRDGHCYTIWPRRRFGIRSTRQLRGYEGAASSDRGSDEQRAA